MNLTQKRTDGLKEDGSLLSNILFGLAFHHILDTYMQVRGGRKKIRDGLLSFFYREKVPAYKHGKIERTINRETFRKLQARVDEVDRRGYPADFIKAIIALLYWSGFRISEIIGGLPHKVIRKDGRITYTKAVPPLVKEQMWCDPEELLPSSSSSSPPIRNLYVRQVARKHGHRLAPISIPLDLDFVDIIVKYWQAAEPGKPIFPIANVTLWRIFKTIDPKLYAHFFILNRLTKQAGDPDISMKDQEDWSG
jgi:hypothetical protein